jgi:hypothetical protein
VDYTKRGLVARFVMNMGSKVGWKNSKVIHGQEIFIDQALIHE